MLRIIFILHKSKKEYLYKEIILRNILLTTLIISLVIDKTYLTIFCMLLGILFFLYDENVNKKGTEYLYLLSLIILTPLISLILDSYYPETANLFSPRISLYLILLISILIFILNIYYFKKTEFCSKNKLYLFILLQLIVYVEYFYLIYFFILK